jgi:hypothetical protein
MGPPETGASKESMPAAPSSSARHRASAGGPVDMSTNAATPAPRSEYATSSTAAGEGSEAIATSAAATASAGVETNAPPTSSPRAGSRSHPTTLWPAATRFRAIGKPIVPRPKNATAAKLYRACFVSISVPNGIRRAGGPLCLMVGTDGSVSLVPDREIGLHRRRLDVRRRHGRRAPRRRPASSR